jgi:hypothetical protein
MGSNVLFTKMTAVNRPCSDHDVTWVRDKYDYHVPLLASDIGLGGEHCRPRSVVLAEI